MVRLLGGLAVKSVDIWLCCRRAFRVEEEATFCKAKSGIAFFFSSACVFYTDCYFLLNTPADMRNSYKSCFILPRWLVPSGDKPEGFFLASSFKNRVPGKRDRRSFLFSFKFQSFSFPQRRIFFLFAQCSGRTDLKKSSGGGGCGGLVGRDQFSRMGGMGKGRIEEWDRVGGGLSEKFLYPYVRFLLLGDDRRTDRPHGRARGLRAELDEEEKPPTNRTKSLMQMLNEALGLRKTNFCNPHSFGFNCQCTQQSNRKAEPNFHNW